MKERIIGELAHRARVEQIVRAKHPELSKDDADDLAQMIYLALLEKSEATIESLWEQGGIDGAINFYIIRIARNQAKSASSPFFKQIRKFRGKSEDIDDYDFTDVTDD